jgi:hypothetical protein
VVFACGFTQTIDAQLGKLMLFDELDDGSCIPVG